jgi:hypothetical protein
MRNRRRQTPLDMCIKTRPTSEARRRGGDCGLRATGARPLRPPGGGGQSLRASRSSLRPIAGLRNATPRHNWATLPSAQVCRSKFLNSDRHCQCRHLPALCELRCRQMPAKCIHHSKGVHMQAEYKPTLRFDAVETRRINSAADKAGLKPAEWMRKLILDNAPQLTIAAPLEVRVSGFEERFGWNLIHYADALAHAEATQTSEIGDVAEYMERYTTAQDGELWIDGDKLPGVSPLDVTSTAARAVDLCRSINMAHIRAMLAREGRVN